MSDHRELKSVVPCTAELGKAVANVLTRDTVSRGYTWNGPNVHFSGVHIRHVDARISWGKLP